MFLKTVFKQKNNRHTLTTSLSFSSADLVTSPSTHMKIPEKSIGLFFGIRMQESKI